MVVSSMRLRFLGGGGAADSESEEVPFEFSWGALAEA